MPIFNEFFNENLDALLLQRGFCYSGRSPAEMPDVWDVGACHRSRWRKQGWSVNDGRGCTRRGASRRGSILIQVRMLTQRIVSPESLYSRLQGFIWI